MTAPALAPVQPQQRKTTVLDVVVPVYNEEADLGPSVRRLVAYLRAEFPYPFRVTIADNASADGTPRVAAGLAGEFDEVRVATLAEKGRGRALRYVWTHSDAAVLAYMDVDLSTDLRALLPLVAPLITGHSDLAIGSRLARGSRVVRGAKREIISRSYNLLLKGTLAASFSDAQCGFKAIRADAARELLPHVRDTGWFFDTELLVLAQNAGMRIHEVPVDWVDDPDSRVDIVSTAVADLKGIARMARTLLTGKVPQPPTPTQAGLLGQLLRFATIGVGSTIAYLALFAFARPTLGAQGANILALLVTAIANTAVNRRLTFGVRGSAHALKHQAQGLLIFALGLLLTAGTLSLIGSTHSAAVEMISLVAANLAATVLRFGLLKVWVFRSA